MTENTEILLTASADVDLDKMLRKISRPTCLCLVKRMQANSQIKKVNRSFKNLSKFKYFGKTLIDQNCMHVELTAG